METDTRSDPRQACSHPASHSTGGLRHWHWRREPCWAVNGPLYCLEFRRSWPMAQHRAHVMYYNPTHQPAQARSCELWRWIRRFGDLEPNGVKWACRIRVFVAFGGASGVGACVAYRVGAHMVYSIQRRSPTFLFDSDAWAWILMTPRLPSHVAITAGLPSSTARQRGSSRHHPAANECPHSRYNCYPCMHSLIPTRCSDR